MPVTFIVMLGSKFNFLEKLFFAIAWSPKVVLAFCNPSAVLLLHCSTFMKSSFKI